VKNYLLNAVKNLYKATFTQDRYACDFECNFKDEHRVHPAHCRGG